MTYRVKLSSQIRTLADCGPVSLLSLWFAPPFRLRTEKVGGLEFSAPQEDLPPGSPPSSYTRWRTRLNP